MALTGAEEALVRELIAQNAALLSLADNEATITSKLGATIAELSDLSATASVSGGDLMLIRQGTTDKSVTPAVLMGPQFQSDALDAIAPLVPASGAVPYFTGASTAGLTTITALAVPAGAILLWSGAVIAIPSGYALCDGTSGTPDLRNRFVVGAGDDYAVADIGGAGEHQHAITVSDHALTTAQLPEHNHTMFANVVSDTPLSGTTTVAVRTSSSPGESEYSMTTGGLTSPSLGITGNTGTGAGHNHAGSSGLADSRPPYYALAFIMKL